MKNKNYSNFKIKINEQNQIVSLINKSDPYQMNWVRKGAQWGKVDQSTDLKVTIQRLINAEQELVEKYIFTNETDFEVNVIGQDLGINLPLPDYYADSQYSLTHCCHTHLWCGLNSSYLMALRMGGKGPNLGLIMTKGSLKGYGIKRNLQLSNVSNDRGIFVVYPENFSLAPGESLSLEWKLVWFKEKEEFNDLLDKQAKFIKVFSDHFLVEKNKEITFKVSSKLLLNDPKIRILRNGKNIEYCKEKNYLKVIDYPDRLGTQHYDIEVGNQKTKANFYVCDQIDELIDKRVHFICKYQQRHDPNSILNGDYLIFDNEEKVQYYDHNKSDHNAGRERVGMAVLIAKYLQDHPDKKIMYSLDQYLTFLFANLFDKETGEVFNDASRSRNRIRLYNYPWVGQLLLEVYNLKHKQNYLDFYFKLMNHFYQSPDFNYYAIGIPMLQSIKIFKKAGLNKQAQKLLFYYREHVDHLIEINSNYPKSEVNYEQSIVAPAVIYMEEVYLLTNNSKYKEASQEHLKRLLLFQGQQPDYHLNETPIRHWDDYWFGKRKLLGDTFPHYWSVLSGIALALAGKKEADKTLKTALSLFHSNGTASCAYVYPMKINDSCGQFYDPWANDQDWELYYVMKYRNYLNESDY